MDDWIWRFPVHINVLEAQAVLRLLRRLAYDGGDLRVPLMVDSQVVRCCLTRGRSSAASLRGVMKKIASVALAFGLYVGARFVPTRLNPADYPTRCSRLPARCRLISKGLSAAALTHLASVCQLRRWISNWCRLVLLLHPTILDFRLDFSCFRSYPLLPALESEWTLDFDSTLGYPGEGLHLLWILLCSVVALPVRGAPPVGVSRSHGDDLRKKQRAGIILDDGRRVTKNTSLTREWLLDRFVKWMESKGHSFQTVVMASPLKQIFLTLCWWSLGGCFLRRGSLTITLVKQSIQLQARGLWYVGLCSRLGIWLLCGALTSRRSTMLLCLFRS